MKHVCLLLFLSLICSCAKESEDESIVYFIGDSQIANWDTEYSFPNRITKNYGKDGAKIDYLYDVNTIEQNSEIVIEIGTNDIKTDWDDRQIEMSVDNYINAIRSFSGSKIFIIEVLPTSDTQKNNNIEKFNKYLKEKILSLNNLKLINAYHLLEDGGVIRNDLTRDGVHLNDYGYIIITNEVMKLL